MDLNSKADQLTRQLAEREGVSPLEAVVIAMEEALERRRPREPINELIDRILKQNGVVPSPTAHIPLPKSVFDEMSGESFEDEPDVR
ncbi:MAG: type II toxin-antitoxin system VapB family antitoxin [Candidatus Devosia phytovorans]|uniref:Type II toxin-antitoxin system VapB family antitoxin n=1 Tax=Candidatus Devosia phytovorans TaxID=3121372 RepID=A0AAJ5VXR8_9HYPH|nr:type II toxin-antitoxin system VapB family antitoxin [Devosia sp.]WEK05417.1 MAG: type II toxin-antitoxin system VapB family antitoxin [Devosia sp.]